MKPTSKNTAKHFVDKMTLPFTSVASYNSWSVFSPFKFTYENDVVTMPDHIYNMWETTIRIKNHMNGEDVINTLSDTWGAWKHAMGTTHLKISTGLFSNDKPELLEFQNYVSSDKKKFVGYVRNRTYNVRPRGCISVTFPELGDRDYFYIPNSISWNEPPIGERLKISNLQQGENYSIHWYSFFQQDIIVRFVKFC